MQTTSRVGQWFVAAITMGLVGCADLVPIEERAETTEASKKDKGSSGSGSGSLSGSAGDGALSKVEATERIDCASAGFKKTVCKSTLTNIRSIRLVKKESSAACTQGSSYGYSADAIWVDRGCRGSFEVTGYRAGAAQVGNCGKLASGKRLARDERVKSCNGRLELAHQKDGNVVLYLDGAALWANGANADNSTYLVMQEDGNLVEYAAGGAIWATNTEGNAGATLAIQDDCNLVLYGKGDKPIWASNTTCGKSAGTPATPKSASCGKLASGKDLGQKQGVKSCDGRNELIHQKDGHVVLYRDGEALWATGVIDSDSTVLSMQEDGNLVEYRGGDPIWASNTDGNPGASLVVQDDCNVVIYDKKNNALWATNTYGCTQH